MEFKIVPYAKDELRKISLFFKKQFNGVGNYGTMDLFQWKIVDNYIMPGFINLAKDGNTIAATTTLTPKRILLKGKCLLGAEIGDSYTDDNYQRKGLFSKLGNKTREDGIACGLNFIYGTPNQNALPGWLKNSNFIVLPNFNVRTLSFPLSVKNILARKMNWFFCEVFCSFFSIALFLVHKFRLNIFLKIGNKLPRQQAIDVVNSLPDDWNVFWETASKKYDFILYKDKDAIEWRFFNNPNKYKFLVHRKDNRIVGYLVYLIIPSIDANRLVVADFLYLPEEETQFLNMLNYVYATALKNNITNIATWVIRNTSYYDLFKKYGFIDRDGIPIIGYKNFSTDEIQKIENCFFSISDSDNI